MDDSRKTTARGAAPPGGGAPQADAATAPVRGDGVFALAPEHRVREGAAPRSPAAASDPDGVFALTPAHRADAGAAPAPSVPEPAIAGPLGGAAPQTHRSGGEDGAGAQVAQAVQRELERVLGAEAAPDLRGFVADEVRRALRGR